MTMMPGIGARFKTSGAGERPHHQGIKLLKIVGIKGDEHIYLGGQWQVHPELEEALLSALQRCTKVDPGDGPQYH